MLSKLDNREKLFVLGAVLLLLVLIVVNVLIWIIDIRRELTNKVIDSRAGFTVLEKAIKDYNFYKSLKTGEEENVNGIFAKLDQIMVRHSLKEKLYDIPKDSYNTVEKIYTRTNIELNFRSVYLQDIIKMVYDIEVNKQLNGRVTYFSFRKVIGKELYDVNLRLSFYSRAAKK
jgi:general secretion pathway protein M